ncbi:MAG: hypothetical protein ABIS14_00355 [Sphingomonas sp.]
MNNHLPGIIALACAPIFALMVFAALRTGEAWGRYGPEASRDTAPFHYWLNVAVQSVLMIGALAIAAWNLLGLDG